MVRDSVKTPAALGMPLTAVSSDADPATTADAPLNSPAVVGDGHAGPELSLIHI